jgi:hypothetical protein
LNDLARIGEVSRQTIRILKSRNPRNEVHARSKWFPTQHEGVNGRFYSSCDMKKLKKIRDVEERTHYVHSSVAIIFSMIFDCLGWTVLSPYSRILRSASFVAPNMSARHPNRLRSILEGFSEGGRRILSPESVLIRGVSIRKQLPLSQPGYCVMQSHFRSTAANMVIAP